ncbi:hypothetical protein AB0M05_29900 [Streptomyces violaceusniger]|uniref:hypothetical protein n=1 Tax=Streptomyces violaceusniger TaxID=68280 RepID=UPI00342AABE7
MPLVCLDSINEVRAAHKMLFDRKFDGPEDVYFGSPFIASVQHKLADALAAAEPSKGWAVWRNAAGHPEKVERVRRHLAGLGEWWIAASVTKREAYVRDVFAPLRVGEELLGELTR